MDEHNVVCYTKFYIKLHTSPGTESNIFPSTSLG